MSFRPVIFNEADVVGGVYVSSASGTTIKSGMFTEIHASATQYGATYGKIYVGPVLPAVGVSVSTLYSPTYPAAVATIDIQSAAKKWVEAIKNKDRVMLVFKDDPDPEATMYTDATISHNDNILIFRGTEFAVHKDYFGAASAFNNTTVGTYLYVGTSGKFVLHSAKSTKVMARVAPVAMVIATANNYASCIYLK